MRRLWRAERIFDGTTIHHGRALLTEGGHVLGLSDDTPDETPDETIDEQITLGPGILAPGFLDLQVNGGGGALLGQGDPDAALATICATHGRLGSTGVMPTLITSSEAVMLDVVEAARRATVDALPGFLGLHLEGPFLDPARKGAHDAALIRPMQDRDLAMLIEAARDLTALMVTLAPENASRDQIAALAAAGVVVSLGHSNAPEAVARDAIAAGATCATHLYNAMSPLGHREPGLVGAVLDGEIWAGIIPDGIHVAPGPFRLALRAKPGRMFAVSDAMAVAGTDRPEFMLNGRRIERRNGRLTLSDGTLAGADISLPHALRWMVQIAGIGLAEALAMMTSVPAQALELERYGTLNAGASADLVLINDDFTLGGVWRAGEPID